MCGAVQRPFEPRHVGEECREGIPVLEETRSAGRVGTNVLIRGIAKELLVDETADYRVDGLERSRERREHMVPVDGKAGLRRQAIAQNLRCGRRCRTPTESGLERGLQLTQWQHTTPLRAPCT